MQDNEAASLPALPVLASSTWSWGLRRRHYVLPCHFGTPSHHGPWNKVFLTIQPLSARGQTPSSHPYIVTSHAPAVLAQEGCRRFEIINVLLCSPQRHHIALLCKARLEETRLPRHASQQQAGPFPLRGTPIFGLVTGIRTPRPLFWAAELRLAADQSPPSPRWASKFASRVVELD